MSLLKQIIFPGEWSVIRLAILVETKLYSSSDNFQAKLFSICAVGKGGAIEVLSVEE